MNTALEIDWNHFVDSPSRKDGIPEHVERHLRADTCKFIDVFGKQQSLAGKIRLLACALFHTFYLRVSFKSINRWETAVACLIIAAKIENKVQTIKKTTRSAAYYLRPHLQQSNIPPQQFYHWMSQIHIRERQIIERLYGELRTSLPITSLELKKLSQIIVDKNQSQLNQKNKHLSNIFLGCFEVLRKIFRSVLCIYYPPPWLAAVALFKSLKRYNCERLHPPKKENNARRNNNGKIAPKLYLTYEWYKMYDPTNLLDLNTIQYISDEIDACDDECESVKNYTSKPAELYGINDLALLNRINLIRCMPFHQLPKQIQSDIRNCFKLKETQYIDLRSNIIKQYEIKNKLLAEKIKNNKMEIDNNNNNNNKDITPPHSETKLSSPPQSDIQNSNISILDSDPSSDWIIGKGPKQRDIIRELQLENNKLKKLNNNKPNPNLEEGEIEDEDDELIPMYNNNNYNNRNRNRKRKRFDDEFRNRNSNKNFETKSSQRRRKNIYEDMFHCGLETYKYVKNDIRNNIQYNEDCDQYYMNYCIQKFEYDNDQNCIKIYPQIKYNKYDTKLNKFIYRIPTPNYIPGNTPVQSQVSPMTPGYGISPITPQYNNNNNNIGNGNGNGNDNEDQDEYWKRTYHNDTQIDSLNDDGFDCIATNNNNNNNSNNNKNNNNNNSNKKNANGNNNSFITKTQRNNYQNNNEPPLKKMKIGHYKTK